MCSPVVRANLVSGDQSFPLQFLVAYFAQPAIEFRIIQTYEARRNDVSKKVSREGERRSSVLRLGNTTDLDTHLLGKLFVLRPYRDQRSCKNIGVVIVVLVGKVGLPPLGGGRLAKLFPGLPFRGEFQDLSPGQPHRVASRSVLVGFLINSGEIPLGVDGLKNE